MWTVDRELTMNRQRCCLYYINELSERVEGEIIDVWRGMVFRISPETILARTGSYHIAVPVNIHLVYRDFRSCAAHIFAFLGHRLLHDLLTGVDLIAQ